MSTIPIIIIIIIIVMTPKGVQQLVTLRVLRSGLSDILNAP